MNKASRNHKRKDDSTPKAVRNIIVITAVIAGVLVCHALFMAYLDRHAWLFGGVGTPDTVYLNDKYRLEKVIALRNGYFIKDIRDGRIIYGREAPGAIGEVNGAVDLAGNILVKLGNHDSEMLLAFDENGEIYETGEPYSVSAKADKPTDSLKVSGGAAALCYDIDGLNIVSVSGTLGLIADNSETVTLFDGDRTDSGGGKWRLEEPYFFGKYVVVHIYHNDCVYRIVSNVQGGDNV